MLRNIDESSTITILHFNLCGIIIDNMKCIGPEKQHKILGRPSARASKGNAEAIIRGGLYILLLRNKENAPERSVALSSWSRKSDP